MKIVLLFLIFNIWSIDVFADGEIRYVTQILEPTGGKIEKPQNWFYRERHSGPSFTWILSEEDPNEGPYNTGVRIQLIQGIKAGTGKSPEEFISNFIANKKQVAEVISECAKAEQGLFYRLCLETRELAVEGTKVKSHIQYSLFWNNEIDIGVFVTAGTSDELWNQKKDIFKAMEAFEFIDMKRFEKSESPGA